MPGGGSTSGEAILKTDNGTAVLDVAAQVLSEVRRAKTAAKRSMRAPVARLTVVDEPARLSLLAEAESDLRQAGHVLVLLTRPGPPEVQVELAADDQATPS